MGSQGSVGDRFRVQVSAERRRRGWSQTELSNRLREVGLLHILASTVAKIENGDRSVRIDEAHAIAQLFGVSTDALLGVSSNGSDVLWAASKLTTNAQRAIGDLIRIQKQVADDATDLAAFSGREGETGPPHPLVSSAVEASAALTAAIERISDMASEFPLPGVRFG